MRIDLNGTPIETGATTLADLITEQNFEAASVATALDGTFIPRDARDRPLHPGAQVEVLSPMQGG